MNYKKLLLPIIGLLSFFLLSDGLLYAQKVIKIRGSSTVQPITTIAARIYGKKHNIRILVEGGGSTKGVQGAGEGIVDIGNASRNLHPDEKKKYPDLVVHTVAYDGIAIILNKKNPLDNLNSKQIVDIYTGRTKNWKELGGPDMPIRLVSKDFGRSTLDLFIEHFKMEVTKKDNLMYYKLKEDKEYGTTGAIVIGQNSEAIVEVSKDSGAIGYVSIGSAERAERKLGKIKRIKIDGIEASRENVKDKTYPIIRPLNLLTKGRPSGDVQGFIDFLLTSQGQNIVKNLDYIPVK
ncbi:MAG: phosphate ABC transporter substrate-binding protein [Thermodesulfovibrionales bacterium]